MGPRSRTVGLDRSRLSRPLHPHHRPRAKAPGRAPRPRPRGRPTCQPTGAKLDKFHLLILDDITYAQKDQAESSVLFELISRRYEHRSLAIAANQPFSAWERVFPDTLRGCGAPATPQRAITVAAIDRLVHHATILEMNTESYRRRAAVRRKADEPPAASTTTTDSLADNHEGDDRTKANRSGLTTGQLGCRRRSTRLTLHTKASWP